MVSVSVHQMSAPDLRLETDETVSGGTDQKGAFDQFAISGQSIESLVIAHRFHGGSTQSSVALPTGIKKRFPVSELLQRCQQLIPRGGDSP